MTPVSNPDSRLPVTLLTGFLGSGKTTLLRHLLTDPAMSDTAVIINEFGEIGLDHHLVSEVDGETVLMASGCVCCTMRDDLADTLRALYDKRAQGDVPPFRRVVIETTGLADPAPIMHTLLRHQDLRERYGLDGVVVTVDAVSGLGQLDRQPESAKQAAMADRLVFTKTDLALSSQLNPLQHRLGQLNPGANQLYAHYGAIDPAQLFDVDPLPDRYLGRETADTEDDVGYLSGALTHVCGPDCRHEIAMAHESSIQSHAFRFEQPMDWAQFSAWLGSLTYFHGEALLRMKGILNVEGESQPVVVHAVQHLVHEPTSLSDWPDSDRSSRLVFITRGLSRERIEQAYAEAVAL